MQIDCRDIVLLHDRGSLVIQIHDTAIVLRGTHVRRRQGKENLRLGLGRNQGLRDLLQLCGIDVWKAGLTRRGVVPERTIMETKVEHQDVGLERDSTRGAHHVVQALHSICGFLRTAITRVVGRVLDERNLCHRIRDHRGVAN